MKLNVVDKSVGKNKALMFESVLQGVPEGDSVFEIERLPSDISKHKGKKLRVKFKGKDNTQVKLKDTPNVKAVKTTTKSLEKESVKGLSEVPILRLEKPVQEETQPKRKLGLSKVDKSTKKPKLKVQKGIDLSFFV